MDKATFLAQAKPIKRHTIPGFGEVHIKSLSWRERLQMEALIKESPSQAALLSVAFALVDQNGNRLFESNDLSQLEECDGKILIKICELVRTVNEITEQDVEKLEKNS